MRAGRPRPYRNGANPGGRMWQRNYYERIIRNERELHAVQEYIRTNPAH